MVGNSGLKIDKAPRIARPPVGSWSGGRLQGCKMIKWQQIGAMAFAVALVVGLSGPARGDFVVAPSGFAATAGGSGLSTLLSSGARTFQEIFGPDQFAGVPLGSTITQVAFRLESNVATVTSELDFASYNVQLGTEAFIPSESFGGNITANTVTVRSGALSIAANTLVGGNVVNPFSFILSFTTPFVYTGGYLVLTVRHSGNGSLSPFLDSTTSGTVRTRYATGASATDPTSAGSNPIAQFQFTPASVPEPASATLLGCAALVAGAALGLRRFGTGRG